MLIEVNGKKGLEITDAIKEYAVKKIQKIEKFYKISDDVRATVLCKVYPTYHKVEVTIPIKNYTLRTETTDVDIYSAIDKSVDKLEAQIKKYKSKLNRASKSSNDGEQIFYIENENNEVLVEPVQKGLFRSKTLNLVPLSLEEAIEQMELVDHDFFCYLDNVTMKVSVLYVREDGEYAKLETVY